MQACYFPHININNIGFLVSNLHWNEMGNFSKLVHHHHDKIMLLACSRKFGDEIYCHHFPLPLRNGQWLQQPSWVSMLILDLLTLQTFSNVLNNFLLHASPIILALDCCNIFLISWVSSIRYIMHFFQDNTP
jgi:hypothetical protein